MNLISFKWVQKKLFKVSKVEIQGKLTPIIFPFIKISNKLYHDNPPWEQGHHKQHHTWERAQNLWGFN